MGLFNFLNKNEKPSIAEDFKTYSSMVINALNALGYKPLDYSIESLKELDTFLDREIENGQPKPGGQLEEHFGQKLFSIIGYVGETIIRNIPGSYWVPNAQDPDDEINIEIHLPSGSIIWPGQRVAKRIKNGMEDSLYVYGKAIVEEKSH